MNKLCFIVLWIRIQAAASYQQKNATLMLNQGSYLSSSLLTCSPDESILIDGIFYYTSTSKGSCLYYTAKCQATLETKYIIHEKCSTKKGNCSIEDILNQARVCQDGSASTDCLVVGYTCVSESRMINICSNVTLIVNTSSVSEETITVLHLDQTQNPNHRSCSCEIYSTTPFYFFVKDIRLYGSTKKCTPAIVIAASWLYECLNKHPWPYFSAFNDISLNLYETTVAINNVESGNYPVTVVAIKGYKSYLVSCETQGTFGKPSTLTTYENSHDNTLLVLLPSVGAGIALVIVLAVLTTCYIYRRKRKFPVIATPAGKSNLYNIRCGNRTDVSEQTPHFQCNDSYVNTNVSTHFAQANIHTKRPVIKLIPDDERMSDYEYVEIQSY